MVSTHCINSCKNYGLTMIKLKTKGKNKNKINKVRATKVLAFFSLAPINC
jgi:hypothetical protein